MRYLGQLKLSRTPFVLPGSTIAETRGAVIQLSRFTGLRGQLRSVLEANAIAGEILKTKLRSCQRGAH